MSQDPVTPPRLPVKPDSGLHDSGERREFTTGAQRDRAVGKGRYDLLPRAAIHRLALQLERGAIKYSNRNWEKGMPLSCYMDSGIRHLFNHLDGMRDEDHLAAAMFNVSALIWTEEEIKAGRLPKELDDLPAARI